MGEMLDSFKEGWREARRPCRECRRGFGSNCRTCPHNAPRHPVLTTLLFALILAAALGVMSIFA